MNSNRCPNCGGIANHYITDIDGHTYYRCNTGLTSFRENGRVSLARVSKIVPCDTILDSTRKPVTATIAFVGQNFRGSPELKTLTVLNGKERR